MGYLVDTWGGDLHQEHIASANFEEWLDASAYMGARMDEGSLCNVLHTDFKAKPGEADAAMLKLVGKAGS